MALDHQTAAGLLLERASVAHLQKLAGSLFGLWSPWEPLDEELLQQSEPSIDCVRDLNTQRLRH